MRLRLSLLLMAFTFAVHGGVRPVGKRADVSKGFASAQSAALFVGVREFPYDATLTEVKYAVDDAVDLAFLLSMELRPRLVEPSRVVLALEGMPQKRESQERLRALLQAGARRAAAAQADVLTQLEIQSRAAGPQGVLIVSFATHGTSSEGTQYLLTASSILQHRETALTDAKVREIASHTDAARALILLDACRKRLTAGTREGDADPRSAAALMREMADINGQVVFSAAAAGGYAYDDDARHNGVFTAAILDGLRCGAPADANGFVTVEALASFVEEHVLSWIQKHREPDARKATQLQCEGRTRAMPLAHCEVSDTATVAVPPSP